MTSANPCGHPRPSGVLAPRLRSLHTLLALLLALTACGGEGPASPPGTGTVAYLVTSCRQSGVDITLQQEVRVLRGGAAPVTVLSVGPWGPFPGFGCGAQGYRRGWLYMEWGPLQRFGITPDGSGLVYELTDEFVSEGRGVLPPEERGIYYVRADGSGRRLLGPASRSPGSFSSPTGGRYVEYTLAFDPSGRQFVYVDRGPDEGGLDAAQVFVREVTPGEPTQVTRLPALDLPGQWPEVAWAWFIDARTIGFHHFGVPAPTVWKLLNVQPDGTGLRDATFVDLPGGQFVPIFQIVGGHWELWNSFMAGVPVNPNGDAPIRELFAVDGQNVVQLTDFRRTDTTLFPGFYSRRDGRAYFTASADPASTNPTKNCQIFSIDPWGRDLRQITFFRETAARETNGCWGDRPSKGCRIDFGFVFFAPSQDPHTGTIYFNSTCDKFGENPYGWQLFAMRPDGAGLRQVTHARGRVRTADGAVEVETVDAFWTAPYE